VCLRLLVLRRRRLPPVVVVVVVVCVGCVGCVGCVDWALGNIDDTLFVTDESAFWVASDADFRKLSVDVFTVFNVCFVLFSKLDVESLLVNGQKKPPNIILRLFSLKRFLYFIVFGIICYNKKIERNYF
jgi:hypothetical protein